MKFRSATEQIYAKHKSVKCIVLVMLCVSTKHVQICAFKRNTFSWQQSCNTQLEGKKLNC